jgi:hypothetical protein
MQRRHLDTLTNRLEHILNAGCAHILWSELYRWYEVQKIAARTYRDIAERWQEVSDGKNGHLKMVEGEGGIHLFAEAGIKSLNGGE